MSCHEACCEEGLKTTGNSEQGVWTKQPPGGLQQYLSAETKAQVTIVSYKTTVWKLCFLLNKFFKNY